MAGIQADGAEQAAEEDNHPPPSVFVRRLVPIKDVYDTSLCPFGRETVQNIVRKTEGVFQMLKYIKPPNGTAHGENASNKKKAKMQKRLQAIRLLFKKLMLVYEQCNKICQGMEYTHMESLIPLKDETENKALDERRKTESYKLALEENKELTKLVGLKNKQLKVIIIKLRTIIWEINVMMAMRRS